MKIYLYSGTHWDREWYKSFQGFRYMLVNMVDDLIDGLEKEEKYGVFHFDGQTIVLEDYLQIAPENRERLTKLIQKGKLIIGPWYDMPDEFNVSGESLIRNIRRGFEVSRSFGVEPMKLGYVCDIFGHTAQLPQIFGQMGISHIALGRGTNEHDTPTFFLWEGPDHTVATTWKLNDPYGYGTLSVNACGGDPLEDEGYQKHLHDVMEREMHRTDLPLCILTDGQDHYPMRHDSWKYLEVIQKFYPEAELYHVGWPEIMKEIDRYTDRMPTKKGELNEVGKLTFLITNTLSSRYDIKQANDRLEDRIEKFVSPIMAFGLIRSRKGFLKLAEKYLLQNHPHDSICGCSIDQVHTDMHYRFDQANLICQELEEEFTKRLYAGLSEVNEPEKDQNRVLRIYNPLPYAIDETVLLTVPFGNDFPYSFAEPFGYEAIYAFRLYDTDGNEIPYGISDIRCGKDRCEYDLRLKTKLIPMGVTELSLIPMPESIRFTDRMAQTANSVDNGIIRVTVNTDGTLEIVDHRTGKTYPRLLTLLDDADIGDGYYHANSCVTETVTNSACDCSVVENNINAVVFRICEHLNVPEAMNYHDRGMRRSDRRKIMDVTHFVTVCRGSAEVFVRTVVDNCVKDHRLKLRLPTGIKGDSYKAAIPFCFVSRKTGVNPETSTWHEFGVAEKQVHGVVYKKDEIGGMAFLAKYAFHEGAVYEDGNIDMTMLRCFSRTMGTEGEPGGQIPGEWTFEYSLLPITPDDTDDALQRRRDRLSVRPVVVQLRSEKARTYEPLLAMEKEALCYSTSDDYNGHLSVRFYNPTEQTVTETISVRGMKKAAKVRLDGEVCDTLEVQNGKVTITVKPFEIYTIAVLDD